MNENRKGFEEWLEEKEAAEEERRRQLWEKREAETDSQKEREKSRQHAYHTWLFTKNFIGKAQWVLPRLAKHRTQEEEKWVEVAISLAAIDQLREKQGAGRAASLRKTFYEWSKHNRTFHDVKVQESTAAKFSQQFLESLEEEKQIEHTSDGKKVYILPGLTYTFPPEPEDGAPTPPLDDDSRVRNALFMKKLSGTWKEAHETVQKRVEEGSSQNALGDESVLPKLKKIGLKRLLDWYNEDQKEEEKKRQQHDKSKEEESKHAHKTWVEQKERFRIKLPRNEEKLKHVVENEEKPVAILNVAPDLIKSTNYVHAQSERELADVRKKLLQKGYVYKYNFRDTDGDFDEEKEQEYKQELETNTALQERVKGKSQKQEEAEEKFGKWASRKKRNEVARQCLIAMPVVTQEEIEAMRLQTEADSLSLVHSSGKNEKERRDQRQLREMVERAKKQAAAARRQNVVLHPTREHVAFWSAVGKALKAIDHTLLPHFLEWSKPLFSAARCVSKWKSLPPTNISDASKTWPDEKRDEGLRTLLTLSSKDRQTFRELHRRSMGQPPSSPLIFRDFEGEKLPNRHFVRCRVKNAERTIRNYIKVNYQSLPPLSLEREEADNETHGSFPFPRLELPKVSCTHGTAELLLRWQCPDNSSPASFFVLETCGAEGSESQRTGDWKVVLVDPPAPESPSDEDQLKYASYSECLTGLLPNTTYHYRMRAFNEYGASGYTFVSFTTAPLAPPTPVPVVSSPQTALVTWTLYGEFRRNFRNLRSLFENIHDGLRQNSRESHVINPFLRAVPRKQLVTAIRHDYTVLNWLQEWPVSANAIRYFAWATLQWELKRRVSEMQGQSLPTGRRIFDSDDFQEALQSLPTTVYQALQEAAWRETAEEDAFLRNYAQVFSSRYGMSSISQEADGLKSGLTAGGVSVQTSQSGDAAVKIANIAAENSLEWVTWGEICFLFGIYAFSPSLLDTEEDLRNNVQSLVLTENQTNGTIAGGTNHSLPFSHKMAYEDGTVTVNGPHADRTITPILESTCCTYCLVPAPDDSAELLALCIPRQVKRFAFGGYPASKGFEQAENILASLKKVDPVGSVCATKGGTRAPAGIRSLGDRDDAVGIVDGVDTKYSLLFCVKDGSSMQNCSPEYEEIFIGKAVTRKLKQLACGMTYHIRVQAINSEGIASELSPPLYFTTPLKTLQAPSLLIKEPSAPSAVKSRNTIHSILSQSCIVTLKWKRIELAQLSNDKTDVDAEDSLISEESTSIGMSLGDNERRSMSARQSGVGKQPQDSRTPMGTDFRSARKLQTGNLLAAWASTDAPGGVGTSKNPDSHASSDGGVGVSLSRLWAQYDYRKNGSISISSFYCMLRDIGCLDFVSSETAVKETLKHLVGQHSTDNPPQWKISPLLEVSQRVDFETFCQWWRERTSTDVVFEVRRSRGIRGWAVNLIEAVMRIMRVLSGSEGNSPKGTPLEKNARTSSMTTNTVKRYLNETQKSYDRAQLGERTEFGNDSVSAYEALTMETTVYRGKDTWLQESSLLPNTLYFFRLRAIAHGPCSKWGEPLPVFTPPLPPSAPVVLETHARSVWLRWYVGEGGASKYVVEAALLQALPPQTTGMKTAANKEALRDSYLRASYRSDIPSERLNWTHVQTSTTQQCVVVSLSANTIYKVRVRALNLAGVASVPSEETVVVTKEGTQWPSSTNFSTACDNPNDVVLGDAIKWTESEVSNSKDNYYKISARVIGDSTSPEQWLKNSLEQSDTATALGSVLPVTSPSKRILSLEIKSTQSVSGTAPTGIAPGILLKRSVGYLFDSCAPITRCRWEDDKQRMSYESEFQKAFALDEALGFQVLVDEASLGMGQIIERHEEPSFQEDTKYSEEDEEEEAKD